MGKSIRRLVEMGCGTDSPASSRAPIANDVRRTDFCCSEYCPLKYCSQRKLHSVNPIPQVLNQDSRSNLFRGARHERVQKTLTLFVKIVQVERIVQRERDQGDVDGVFH